MLIKFALLPTAIPEMFAQIVTSGRITLADRYGLMAAVMSEMLDDEERAAVDRVLRGVYRGRYKIVDELSAIED